MYFILKRLDPPRSYISAAIYGLLCLLLLSGGLVPIGSWFLKSMLLLIVVILGGSVAVLYCAARVYVVAESLASVRALPVGSFKTVSWGDIVQHF